MSGDKIAKKIVDLSKRNRELGAEVIRHKQTVRDLQSKIREYEVGMVMCDVYVFTTCQCSLHVTITIITSHYHCLLL